MDNTKDTPALLAALRNYYQSKIEIGHSLAREGNEGLSNLYDIAKTAGFNLSEQYKEEMK